MSVAKSSEASEAEVYLDLPTVTNFCLFIYKTCQKADILHSWKIQVWGMCVFVGVK